MTDTFCVDYSARLNASGEGRDSKTKGDKDTRSLSTDPASNATLIARPPHFHPLNG